MTEWPLVTVIMPVLNEASFITRSLGSVLAQDYPADRLEILVVDGGSTDETRALVAALAARDDRVRLLHNPGRIQARALNIGIAAARGTIVARVDGHAVLEHDYLRRCVEHLATLRDQRAATVGGAQRFVGTTPTGRAIEVAYRSLFGVPSCYTVRTDGAQPEAVDQVYLGCWPREVLARVGGFNESLAINEDYEINVRIRRMGGRVFLAPDVRVSYYGRQSLDALWTQYFRYGAGKFQMLSQHPRSVRPRQVVAPLFVAALIGGGLLAPLHRWLARGWALVVTSYALANGMATWGETRRQNRSGDGGRGRVMRWRLTLVFATMHIAWGLGFWRGALRVVWSRLRR